MPLDFQKFLPKYSDSQKWATPLDFQKFFIKNIQKTKNGLRIKCYAPHSSKASLCPPSPRGEGYIKGDYLKF